MPNRISRGVVANSLILLLSACGAGGSGTTVSDNVPSGPAISNPDTGDTVPAQRMRIVNALPPGQSGFVSLAGQLQGMASGNPGDFGEHIDDQRLMYWSFQLKPGGFADISQLAPEQPREGLRIYRDEFGIPIVYADDTEALGFGTGYALAQDRLFLQDAGRRTARGTLAELTGPGTVPADIQTRILTYSEAEYQAMFDRQSEEARTLIQGFVDGTNAWIQQVLTNPNLLPAEYALLQTSPAPITVTDVVAAGVLITRSVASDGGNEFDNVAAIKDLVVMHGDADARTILQDLLWFDDRKAAVTVPLEEGEFTNINTPPAQRTNVFNAVFDYALTLPDSLATGPGTGNAPVPGVAGATTALGNQLAARMRELFDVGVGASYMLAVSPERSANGKPLLINGPQLGYSYPSQLMEIEVHGAGFDARGATAPLLPVVGIDYGERTAWGVTTGNSKTIDSFVETLVEGHPNQYMHNGEIKDMDCRTETVSYRASTAVADGIPDVPVGPALFSQDIQVCRTVHGPVVARSDDGRFARTLQYAMWNREIDTVRGVLQWGKVDTFSEFDAAVREVTWNENVMFAGADGTIAYYHPGLHPDRAPQGDQRFPLPGTGEFDHAGFLAFARLPKAINPARGYIANWNEKPSLGWGEGAGGGNSRPAGSEQRVTNWTDQTAADGQITFDEILAMDKESGIRDPRARAFVPILAELRNDAELTPRQQALVDTVLAWDGHHYRDDIDITNENARDTAGATVDELFAQVLPDDLFDRLNAVGNHEYGAPPLFNLAVRILDPSRSSITPVFDFTAGRGGDAALIAAINDADQRLQAQFGGMDIASYTRVHHRDEVCSLTGGIIGPCLTMPHQDRGS